jgi:alpha-L-fucosidase 2
MSSPLWFPAPALHWNEALPVGNGTLGGMVFGAPYQERIALNHDRLWAGGPRDRVNPRAAEALPRVRELIFAGHEAEAQRLAAETLLGVPPRIESYEPLGDLLIDFAYQGAVSGYRREVDLEAGVVRVTLTKDDIPCVHEVYASHPNQVLVVDLRSAHAQRCPYALRVRLDRAVQARMTLEGADAVLRGATEAGLPFVARARVIGAEASARDGALTTGWSKQAAILVAAEVGADAEAQVIRRLDAAAVLGADRLAERHRADWSSHYGRLTVDFAGPDLSARSLPERLAALDAGGADPVIVAAAGIQYRRYLQLCSSRPGSLPSNLQGIWNQDMRAAWNSDYHPNINLQMNYWPHERSNLATTIVPLIDWLESIVPSGTETARRMYGCRGWVLHHVSDRWGCTTPCDGLCGIWPVGGAWMAQHAWWHYQYSGDRAFLASRIWPLLQGAARFLIDFLVEAPPGTPAAGFLVTNPSHSPENKFRKTDGTVTDLTSLATMDLGIIRECLESCIAAAGILGAHADFAAECRAALDRLPPYRISRRYGCIQEWIEDHEEVEPGHRHISHLFGLFPGSSIATPELVAAARASLERRLAHQHGHHQETGWSLGWQSCLWARLGDGDRAYTAVRSTLGHRSLPNLMTDAHGHAQVGDAHGITMGLFECLVQDHGSEVHLLPALPSALPTGSIRGLRLRGGHELDLVWAEGRLTQAVIRAGTAGEVAVRLGGGVRRLRLDAGQAATIA